MQFLNSFAFALYIFQAIRFFLAASMFDLTLGVSIQLINFSIH